MILRWTKTAARDMVHVKEFKAKESAVFADEFVDRVFERLENQILPFPQSGQVVSEYGRDDINEIIVYSFRVVYQILPDQILVLTVIHGANPLPNIPPVPQS